MFVSALFGLLGAFLWALLKTPEDALSTSMKNNDQFKDQVLDFHNFFREQHGAEDLSWNASIAGMAEEWASNCNFKHSQAGQNLVAGFPDVARSIDAWGLERLNYDWNEPGFGETTGHFSQVVWKGSNQLGCGRKLCPAGTIFPNVQVWYVVCNYAPAGNMVGDTNNEFFIENVGYQVSREPRIGIVEYMKSPSETNLMRSFEKVAKPVSLAKELQGKAARLVYFVGKLVLEQWAALADRVV